MSGPFKVLLLLLLSLSTGFSVEQTNSTFDIDTSVENTTSLDYLTTSKVYTWSDFIVLRLNDFAIKYREGTIVFKERIGRFLVYEDENGTLYAPFTQTQEEKQKAIEEQLKNNSDTICTADGCFDPNRARVQLSNILAYKEKRLLPTRIPEFAAIVSVYIVVGLVGITGNVLIISGVFRSGALRNSTTVFLSSLALSDIIVLAVCLPMLVFNRFFSVYNLIGLHVCRLLYYVRYFSIVSSIFTMTAIAVERYLAICYPLKAKSYCTVKNALKAVVVLWVLSSLVCIPVIFTIVAESSGCIVDIPGYWEVPVFYLAECTVIFVIPIFIMGPLYSRMFYVLWKSTKESANMQRSTADESQSGSYNKRSPVRMRRKVVKMLVVLLITFCVCWGPAAALEAIDSFRRYMPGSQTVWRHKSIIALVLDSLAIGNSCLNPLIYIFMSSQFRSYLKNLCRCGKVYGATTEKDDKQSSADPSVKTQSVNIP